MEAQFHCVGNHMGARRLQKRKGTSSCPKTQARGLL